VSGRRSVTTRVAEGADAKLSEDDTMRKLGVRLAAILIASMTVLLVGNSSASAQGDSAAEERVLRDANAIEQQLNAFWASDFRNHGLTYVQPSQFEYYHTTGNRPCGENNISWARNAFYCGGADVNFVNFDIDWFSSELTNYPGDILTWWVLAHEWGHSVQANWAARQPGVDQYAAGYRKEIQADCLAGVFIGQAVLQGTMTLEDGDPQALITTMSKAADGNWFNPGTHGTPAQRLTAFNTGLQTNSDTCRVNDGMPAGQ
jgi:uncharacterized protein